MLILFGVGLWFARRQKELKTYLLADQNVHWVIVGSRFWRRSSADQLQVALPKPSSMTCPTVGNRHF
jgi:hypothetical protein